MKRRVIAEALLYIDTHYGDTLVLEELADTAGYSVPQFSRLFSELCNITPMRYVNIVRIQRAAEMLMDGMSASPTLPLRAVLNRLKCLSDNSNDIIRYHLLHIGTVFTCRRVRSIYLKTCVMKGCGEQC